MSAGLPRPWVLGDSSWSTVREARYRVAVLPWGATEAHNYHLPYGTDTMQATHVAEEAARLAWEGGARPLVLPPIGYGVQTGQLDVPFCINMNPSTQAAVLADLVASIEPHGIRALVLVNGHGGNEFRPIVRELQPRTSVFLVVVNWWACLPGRDYFEEPGDHAGELETSVMQHLAPGLVLPVEEAGPGRARPWRIAGVREGWAWAPRRWTQATEDTGVGDPSRATPDKGSAFFTAATERIAGLLRELDSVDTGRLHVEVPEREAGP